MPSGTLAPAARSSARSCAVVTVELGLDGHALGAAVRAACVVVAVTGGSARVLNSAAHSSVGCRIEVETDARAWDEYVLDMNVVVCNYPTVEQVVGFGAWLSRRRWVCSRFGQYGGGHYWSVGKSSRRYRAAYLINKAVTQSQPPWRGFFLAVAVAVAVAVVLRCTT